MIDRFSEDIDLSVNHIFFEIEKTTKSQREKLRKKARRYILDVVSKELETNLKSMGVKGFRIETVTKTVDNKGAATTIASDKDPSVILLHYTSILNGYNEYTTTRKNRNQLPVNE